MKDMDYGLIVEKHSEASCVKKWQYEHFKSDDVCVIIRVRE